MAAVVDIRTASRFAGTDRPDLVLIESPVDWGRIYLKRRILAGVTALAMILAVLIGVAMVWPSSGPAAVTSSMAGETHVVTAGETLWSIAKDVRPDSDPRSTIMLVAELNSHDGVAFDAWAPLVVGQRIRVPADR